MRVKHWENNILRHLNNFICNALSNPTDSLKVQSYPGYTTIPCCFIFPNFDYTLWRLKLARKDVLYCPEHPASLLSWKVHDTLNIPDFKVFTLVLGLWFEHGLICLWLAVSCVYTKKTTSNWKEKLFIGVICNWL